MAPGSIPLSFHRIMLAGAPILFWGLAIPAFAQPATPPPDAGVPRVNPTQLPTDLTPLIFTGERGLLSREVKFSLLKHLPERMWFNTSTEVSQRFESNPAFSATNSKGDYVFRTLPNVTVGYDLFKGTSVYANYFVIKDVFARTQHFTNPTTQSLSMGVRKPFSITRKLSGQLDFQARELWQASHLHQFDFLPSAGLTYVVSPNVILFASSVLQMRGREYFAAPNREIDPFYSAGLLLRKGQWNFVATDTLVNNFRNPPFTNSIPQHGNVSMIADFEINRPINNKYLPGVVAFVRAEPVWNWRSNKITGLSGFDFRLFSGIRVALNKPSYHATIERMEKNIRDYDKKMRTQQNRQQNPNEPTTQLPVPTPDAPQQLLSENRAEPLQQGADVNSQNVETSTDPTQ